MDAADDVTDPTGIPRTGHSKKLRDRLRAARKSRGLTQQQVCDLIMERMPDWYGRDVHVADSTLSSWEKFQRHPPVDVMACWARVLGLRLIVELDDAKSTRVPVLLHPKTAEVARVLDNLSEDDFKWVVETVRRGVRR